jgi:4-diphosphocytidyl-2-C-methyl-D-erythritol kinase
VALTLPLVARAPAKLNLCLYVGPRRDDGLHDICSIFQSISLSDEIKVELAERDEVVCPGVSGRNLALTALERFRSDYGLDEAGIRVTIAKGIPVAAGLGGGSADAAAVLRVCGAVRGVERQELLPLATAIGADVPSQLTPGTALVTGAGERVEAAGPFGQLECVLLHGVGKLDTALVYSQADALSATRPSLARLEQRLRKALDDAGGDAIALAEFFDNDLQAIAGRLEPAVERARGLLREEGALVTLVSGSGPAVFGLFADRDQAEQAGAALAERWNGAVSVVQPVDADYAATSSLSGSGQ